MDNEQCWSNSSVIPIYPDIGVWNSERSKAWMCHHMSVIVSQNTSNSFVQANIMETSELCITAPLWRESTGDLLKKS